jgi:hypothetical protein
MSVVISRFADFCCSVYIFAAYSRQKSTKPNIPNQEEGSGTFLGENAMPPGFFNPPAPGVTKVSIKAPV